MATPYPDPQKSKRSIRQLLKCNQSNVLLARAGINGAPYDKLALIIMSDGLENASREYSHAAAKTLLDDCRARNWQVIFLGAVAPNLLVSTFPDWLVLAAGGR